MYSCAGLAEARGCPIRIFTDQSLFAAPHDFSQRTTSFIASQCQGIHQMLLSRLMLSLPMSIRYWPTACAEGRGIRPRQIGRTNIRSKKDLYVLDLPAAVGQALRLTRPNHTSQSWPAQAKQANPFIHDVNQQDAHSIQSGETGYEVSTATCRNNNTVMEWWSQTGSNRRPEACKATALPTELWPRLTHMIRSRSLKTQPQSGGPGKTRTSDLTLIKRAL
jgi:hypothetical protein